MRSMEDQENFLKFVYLTHKRFCSALSRIVNCKHSQDLYKDVDFQGSLKYFL